MPTSPAKDRAPRTIVPVPEPNLAPQEMLARAAALKLLLRRRQAENDEGSAHSPELHQAFLDAARDSAQSRISGRHRRTEILARLRFPLDYWSGT